MSYTHHKFAEIDNLTPALIQEIRDQGLDKGLWCIETKYDGANLQIAIDVDGSIHFGSRNQELGRYDSFNNWAHVVAKDDMENKVRKLKEELDKYWLVDIANSGPYIFVVYFELIGGYYRHKDVQPVKGAVKMQGRVNYCPDNELICLDILYFVPTDNGGYGDYLAPETVNEYCDKVGIRHAKINAVLPFDDAIKYPNDFEDTTGPEMFGLPQVTPNIIEGVVLKPRIPGRFRNGARLIAKNKNQIFLERGVKTNKVKNPPEPMTELDEEWYNTYMEFVTESRMMSVLSKMDTTTITGKDFGKLLSAFIEDADKDFQKEYGGQILVLEAEHPISEFNMHKVLKAAKSEASKMIRPHFLNFLQQNGTMKG
jgi:Rnl2 family RNA ligase